MQWNMIPSCKRCRKLRNTNSNGACTKSWTRNIILHQLQYRNAYALKTFLTTYTPQLRYQTGHAFYTPAPTGWKDGGIKRSFCLTFCLTSVMFIRPNSRTERPRKTKIGTVVAHVTRDSDTTFKVKRSKIKGGGISWRPPAYSLFLEHRNKVGQMLFLTSPASYMSNSRMLSTTLTTTLVVF